MANSKTIIRKSTGNQTKKTISNKKQSQPVIKSGGTHADVIIAGAGISGMYAADVLTKAGKSVLVLEARDRVGGRTWTAPFGKDMVDYGGQWIGPSQLRVNSLIRELGIDTYHTFSEGKKIVDVFGKISSYEGLIPRVAPHHLIFMQYAITRVDSMAKKLSASAPWEYKKARIWDALTLDTWQKRNMWTRVSRELMNGAVRVIFGSEPADLSLLHFLHYINSSGGLKKMIDVKEGSQQDRMIGGAMGISTRLAERIGKNKVILNSPVQSIEQQGKLTKLKCPDNTYTAKKVIIALPPAMINRIWFKPALPPMKAQLYQRSPMTATIKVFVEYAEPFWRARGYSGEIVSTDGVFSVMFDNVSYNGKTNTLLGFIVGDRARGWYLQPEEVRKQRVMETIVRYFGSEGRNILRYAEADWTKEEFSGGAPIGTFTTNTLSTFGPWLREPVGNIYFAGTETARESTGFIEGAIEAGDRAAQEIL